jgi:hypothetical protein
MARPERFELPTALVRSWHREKLSFDFIHEIRVAPVASGTTEHN